MNVVSYNFYNKSMNKLLAWLIGSYNLYNAFRQNNLYYLIRILVKNHDEWQEEIKNFNDFQEDDNIVDYIENDETYTEALLLCLKNKFEIIAK